MKKSLIKSAASAFLLFLVSQNTAHAQCNVFANADSANPVLSAITSTQTITSIDFPDIDNDGDADCYVLFATGNPVLYTNIGNPHHPVFQQAAASGFEALTTPEASPIMQFTDIDGDGDNDCFITELSYEFRPVTRIRFYRNTGDASHPVFTEDEDNNPVNFAFCNNNFVYFTFADIDKDGLMDFYYTGFFNTTLGDYDQFTYLNKGTKQSPSFVLYSNEHPHDFERQRTYYDWTEDGLPDYIKFESTQAIYSFLKNTGPLEHPEFMTTNQNTPQYTNGMPFRMVDLNNDGAPEAFTANGHFSTIAPVAVIKSSIKKMGNTSVLRLAATTQSDSYQYQWRFNGKLLTGINKPAIYALKPGTYVLHITNDCGTGISLPYVVTDENLIAAATDKSNTALNALSSASVTTYPNPFVSEITVKLPSANGAKSTVKISDLAGRLMLSQTATGGTIKLGNNLQQGMYILQVWQNNEVIYTTKIAKQ